jgi:NAD(P)-dependent dehydrogenase (short-subunit alcohol dehydrogenase family)
MLQSSAASLAVVTGSSRGIGRAVAVRLAHDGHDVVVHYRRDGAAAAETAAAIRATGRAAWMLAADLEQPQDVRALVDGVAALDRRVAVLVSSGDERPGDEALRQHLAARFAKWWVPDAFFWVDAIPRTATGKFLKSALRERFRDTYTDDE